MQAQDLRYGNWIFYKASQIPVTMIGEYGIQSNYNGRLINAKFSTPDLTPIPLTPELLEKCGWVKWENEAYPIAFKRNNEAFSFRIFWYRDDICVEPFGENNGHDSIEHLHHLQNLYFAITREDFEVNL